MREKSHLIAWNLLGYAGCAAVLCLLTLPVHGQDYYPDAVNREQYYQDQFYNRMGYDQPPPVAAPAPRDRRQVGRHPGRNATANLQYDPRDAEAILREQLARTRQYPRAEAPVPDQHPRAQAPVPEQVYDNYYDHRINNEGRLQQVMAEARYLGNVVKGRNGKSSVIVDKRNFQFYLYDRDGGLLRVGPVAIGKGQTEVGAFETPVGVFPISRKVPVDDWVRPDWYFIEEGEPIPKKYEDRRVPGFFRYKLVFDGARYIHYAEATGGRLTHGCLGLDWQDAEAVFHTLEVGSYCIVADNQLLSRLARGEFPNRKPVAVAKPSKPEDGAATVTAKAENERLAEAVVDVPKPTAPARAFRDLW
jgi:lipoprotein-anchoring transpeptidase ErfK/SrfK